MSSDNLAIRHVPPFIKDTPSLVDLSTLYTHSDKIPENLPRINWERIQNSTESFQSGGAYEEIVSMLNLLLNSLPSFPFPPFMEISDGKTDNGKINEEVKNILKDHGIITPKKEEVEEEEGDKVQAILKKHGIREEKFPQELVYELLELLKKNK